MFVNKTKGFSDENPFVYALFEFKKILIRLQGIRS